MFVPRCQMKLPYTWLAIEDVQVIGKGKPCSVDVFCEHCRDRSRYDINTKYALEDPDIVVHQHGSCSGPDLQPVVTADDEVDDDQQLEDAASSLTLAPSSPSTSISAPTIMSQIAPSPSDNRSTNVSPPRLFVYEDYIVNKFEVDGYRLYTVHNSNRATVAFLVREARICSR